MAQTYIIVDGIDECDLSERKAILSFFVPLVERDDSPGRLRAIFVSQDESDIQRLLRAATILRLTDAHNQTDIENFAAHWSIKIQQKFGLPDITGEYIRSVVCAGSDGTYAIQGAISLS
jgi:hypothetical protein